jgi:pimeloyl-ACP methyl ester carboxylesterase
VRIGDDSFEVLDLPGANPPILLLHEGLGCVGLWRDYPAQLAAATGSRIVAYSRLGFGKSSARRSPYTERFMHEEAQETLPALRKALSLERPVLLGHSTGGSMALLHAAHDAGGVAGVIAMAPLLDVEESNLASIREAKAIFETTPWGKKLARHHDHPIEEVFASWNDTWLAPFWRNWSIAGDLRPIRCPVLAVGGRDDPYSTPRQLDLVQNGLDPAVRLVRLDLEDCGHVPYRDQPEATMAAVVRLVADV